MRGRPARRRLPKEVLDAGEAAAIKAGYSPKSARRTASRLMRTPRIIEEIRRRLHERERTADENSRAD